MEKVKMKIKRHISLFLSIVIMVEFIGTIDLSVYANDQNDYCTDKISTFDSSYNMADDFDFLEYLVKHYTSDEVKNTIKYRTNDKTNCQNLVEYLNDNGLFQLSYAEWEAASFITNPSEIITECLDKETYYETILLRVLNSSVTSDNAIDWLNQGAIKNSVKMLKNITKFAEVNHYAYLLDRHTLISDLSESEVDKITTFSKNYIDSQPYKIFNKDLDFISDLLSVSKDVEQYSEKLASYCQLMELGDAVVDFLGGIKSNTSDKHLEKAIDRIIPIIEDSYISMLKTAVADGVITVGETALKKIVGDIWKKSLINLLENGVLYNGTVIVNSTFLAIGITKLIGNIAFSTDAKLDKYELMKALCSFEEAMNKAICELLNDNRQVDNYSNLLLESVAIFYQTYIVDTELQTELIKICKNDWVKFTSNQEFEKLLEISKNNKETYKTEYDSITIKSGACGNTLFWVITNDCELIVYGIGDTNDYTSTTLPWKDNLLDIKKIYISSFTNKIGTFFLYGLCNVNNSIAFNSVSIAEHNLDELNTNLLVNGDLKILGENKLLKKLDVNGSFTMDFVTCTFSVDEGATLNVKNNIFVSGGYWGLRAPRLENKGIVDVGGNANFEYTGYLIMHTDSAKLNIGGNFSHSGNYNEIDAGIISVKGDIDSKTKFGGTNTLVLNGNEPQKISALNAQNLTIYNTSVEGVTIVNPCYVYGKIQSEYTKIIDGKNINLSGGQIQGCYLGDLSVDNIIVKNDAEVKGNLYVTNDCRIASGCALTVDDFTMDFVTCTFSVDEGATLNVKNNIFVSGGYWGLRAPRLENKGIVDVGGNANFEYTGYLIMHTDSAKLNIGGNFSHSGNYNEIDAGIISVKGDIDSKTKFGGTNTLVLNGNESQTINASDFSTIEIYNSAGVIFNNYINVNVLFNHNGNKFVLEKGGTFVDYDDDGLLDNVDPYPAQVHYWQEIRRVEATCTSDGYYILYCSDCDQQKKVLIKKIEHNYILTNHINPTFESSGYDEYKCTACSNVKKVEIKALDGSALEAALDESKKRIDSKVYTDESIINVQIVYDKYKNSNIKFNNQSEVNDAASEVLESCNNLIVKDVVSGSINSNMTWTYTKSNSKLNISGIGEVPCYLNDTSPWYYCEPITEINFENGITSIEGNAFRNYHTIKSINFPSTLTTVNIRAFEYCDSVEELVIPDSVIFIGYGAFASLTSLKKVTVPASVGYASYAFEHDEQIEKITITPGVDGIMPECTRTNNVGFSFGSNIKYTGAFGPWRNANNAIVDIQYGVKSIGKNTFYGARISQLTIMDSVKEIGYQALKTISNTDVYVYNRDCVIDETNTNLSNVNIMIKNINDEFVKKEHTHNWSDWKYNNDAVYNSSSDYKDGTQTRTCSACGESETKEAPNTAFLRRRGNALSLESSITLATYITKDVVDYYDEVYVEFTRNGNTEKVYPSGKTLTSGSTVYCIFDYTGISPQALGDDVSITFYGIKDGVAYNGNAYKYSATDYIKSTLNKPTSSAKLKTLLVDLVYYGEACQVYQNYKTDNLLTDILTDEQKALHSTDDLDLTNIKNASYEICENRLVKFGTALRLNNSVEIAIPLNMTNVTLDDLSFKVKIGSRTLTYTYAENPDNFEKGKDGYWYFYFDGVYANQMSDEVFITAYKGDEQVSYTLKYSVESYAATVTDTKLKAVTDAMMRYGNSAKAYASK